jgi:hypothetical protein
LLILKPRLPESHPLLVVLRGCGDAKTGDQTADFFPARPHLSHSLCALSPDQRPSIDIMPVKIAAKIVTLTRSWPSFHSAGHAAKCLSWQSIFLDLYALK